MQRLFWSISAIALLLVASAFGQSLGEAARDNRQQQQAAQANGAQPKVITNQDLAKDPDGDDESGDVHPPARKTNNRNTDVRAAQQRQASQRAAEQQWKSRIQAQETKVADLQARVDQLNTSLHSTTGGVQSEGPYNRFQARQVQRLDELQFQLSEQKKKLDDLQDAARHAGMKTSVYDP